MWRPVAVANGIGLDTTTALKFEPRGRKASNDPKCSPDHASARSVSNHLESSLKRLNVAHACLPNLYRPNPSTAARTYADVIYPSNHHPIPKHLPIVWVGSAGDDGWATSPHGNQMVSLL